MKDFCQNYMRSWWLIPFGKWYNDSTKQRVSEFNKRVEIVKEERDIISMMSSLNIAHEQIWEIEEKLTHQI